jgi:hypothetical protein
MGPADERQTADIAMKLVQSASMPCPAPICSSDFDDNEQDFLQDVWEPTGDAATELEITTVFRSAGYVIRKIELVECHRVWIIKLRRGTAPKIHVQEEFHRHVRKILETVKICFRKKSDPTAQLVSDRALVTFIWPETVPVSIASVPRIARQPR